MQALHMRAEITYPISLDATALQSILPHRGEILFAHSLIVLAHNHYQGHAIWPTHFAAIQGHFPERAIVPGVYLVEAFAQLAGAGLLTGDPYVQSLEKSNVCVLASIRKTAFKHPVFPDRLIEFDIHCRQLGASSVQATGSASHDGIELAQLDILLLHASRERLQLSEQTD
jgi:3-hydroxyacyl-[acyl-carrier-protein] dehydratase